MFKKDAITGWVILALGIVFIWMSIDPLINDTPDDSNDQYETWLNNEFSEDTTKEKDNEDK